MDSRIGLDYIVENRDYIIKLGTALDTDNVVVKKQVFELLSALCAYNTDGYMRALETLEFYKNLKSERYRFKIVINELEKATCTEYQIALLAFINCIIISATNLQDRIHIRNEFIGLKILPLLNNLRKVCQSVGDIIVQLDVFDEQRECDEAQSLQSPNGINLNSHLDVFYAILRQVADTPLEVPFLSILQHLLRIDSKESVSDLIWDTAEKLVHRATLLENHEDSARLLRSLTTQKFTCSNCRCDATSPSRKTSGVTTSSHNGSLPPASSPLSTNISKQAVQSPPSAAPPAPPNMLAQGAPPPPPLPLICRPPAPPPPAPNNLLIPPNPNMARPVTPELRHNGILLPQQDTPAPKTKMKTLNWGKIPPNKVLGKQNIWTIVASNHQDSPMTDMDWNEMEGLFCIQSTNTQGSPKLSRHDTTNSSYDTLDRKTKKENTEITLLDGKRSLNVNIYLKQFKGYNSNEDIIQLIHSGDHEHIGAEKLRGLLKILPEVDELDMLKTFNGDFQRLGNAEKFLLQLLEVPNYKLRIESMLLKEEFSANISYLTPCINDMIYAGESLINNKYLQEVLYMIVVAGNFLNSGGYAGNAAGVKLTSLQKLTDIRANKPGMNLIHFVAKQAEKRNTALLNFTNELSILESASKTTPEQINNEINTLDNRIQRIKKQIELPSTDKDIKNQMLDFLQIAEEEVTTLKDNMRDVEATRIKLADFFCEDPATFKLEECLKTFQNFCDKFKQAIKENERRQHLEDQANIRRKQREEQLARKLKYSIQCSTPVSDGEVGLDGNFDLRNSPAFTRRRIGSFEAGTSGTSGDGNSPDITPNGTIRRRRSRVLTDEDDDLMAFLRTSGHEHQSRERKVAYGSLDRSWARRARSGSSNRKRPDLLHVDFGVDRERPTSPNPIISQDKIARNNENTPQTNGEFKNKIPREWRQKIETWLQSNESDDKQDEDYKRKRRLLNINRRSLENDSESERKLDTLPEEKYVPTTPNLTTFNSTSTSDHHFNNSLTLATNNSNCENYKRVYPDWKPSNTLETDVVGTIQAIADVNHAREKLHKQEASSPPVRVNNGVTPKTSTNNYQQQNDKAVTYRRQKSIENTITLESIAEEDRRKSLSQNLTESGPSDRLHIYIRGSSIKNVTKEKQNKSEKATVISTNSLDSSKDVLTKSASNTKVSSKSPTDEGEGNLQHSVNTSDQLTPISNQNEQNNNRKEIDADNIETPPVTRRIISHPTTTLVTINRVRSSLTTPGKQNHNNGNKMDEKSLMVNELTPGHFDRYSLARRTRRFKRSTDYSSGNEDLTSTKDSSEDSSLRQTFSANEIPKALNKSDDKTLSETNLKNKFTEETKRPVLSARAINKLERVGHHISSINQEDVQEAIRNLKSPTNIPENLWSPTRNAVKQKINPISIQSTIMNGATIIKTSSHELNDEGFEETQSLVSDTPSHGKESPNSSCNELLQELPDNSKPLLQKRNNAIQKISGKLADRLQISKLKNIPSMRSLPTSSQNTPRKTINSIEKSGPHGQLGQNLTKSNLPSNTQRRPSTTGHRPNAIELRGGSNKYSVERSSSRNSLRSSRSSINSATSTNTVRHIPVKVHSKLPLHTVSVESSPSKRPLTPLNNKTSSVHNLNAVPASRSSSSASSNGQNVVVIRKNSTTIPHNTQRNSDLGSTSFKENHRENGMVSASIKSNQIVRHPTHMKSSTNPSTTNTNSCGATRSMIRSTSTARGNNVSGFMKPTAASSTKRNK